MLFNSLGFLFLFLPAALAICLPSRGRGLLRAITLLSFLFYAFAGHAWFLIPMLVTTGLDFWLGRWMAASAVPRTRKAILCSSIIANLGLLFYFKYAGLLLDTARLLGLLRVEPWTVVLPAGISFYTFQTMSYMIDIYRGEAHAEKDFWKFAGFVSFFPHLVAGPLTRHNQLLPQLGRIADTGINARWRAGFFLFAVGLAKKVLIADQLAAAIDPTINQAAEMGLAQAWAAILGYSLQIYFDFSGYSDMALGLGRLFGIELPLNFDSPYQALSPSDFWRRWHITLSRWLRDYLYISLGGNRCSPRRRAFNLMATMVLGGLWHGANWTFAAWGFYHGLLLIVHHAYEDAWARLPAWLRRGATFLLVTLGWVFFRAPSFPDAIRWFRGVFALAPAGTLDGGLFQAKFLAVLIVGLILALFFPNAASYSGYDKLRPRLQVALALGAAAAILTMGGSSRFLYFQF